MRRSFGNIAFDAANVGILVLFSIVMLYPIVYVISASISDSAAVTSGQVLLWPRMVTVAAYRNILSDPNMWLSYWNTIRYTAVQTVLALIVTAAMAYPLSKKWVLGRKWILILCAFTLVFSGGMIPTFLVVKQLHLLNSLWAIVLPTLVSTWHLFIMRTFFEGMPEEIEDAATIDGCGTLQTLLYVVIPLSLPIIVTIGLYTAVNQWNSFFEAMIYLNDGKLQPLQIMLRDILISSTNPQEESNFSDIESLKYAMIVVATLPILCVYPFVQKYFVQGSLVGGVKG